MGLLEKKIRYEFKNKGLLTHALTHSSYTNEVDTETGSNQRLEFLGDSVLSVVVSSYLYKKFPDIDEGELSRMRASFVCMNSLAALAEEIDLGRYLLLGKGEEASGGRKRKSNLEDTYEALIGAVYLDGGIKGARKFIMPLLEKRFSGKDGKKTKDYKTVLQEVIQKNPEEIVEYVIVDVQGPPHKRFFKAEVHLNRNVIGRGEGDSKKMAEQNAAKEALGLMGL